uniref:UspA domain-containing protein n=2 Tax=Octopus bimaculoides TaxID=37653 RepID=A0A0L8FFM7_OCTBM
MVRKLMEKYTNKLKMAKLQGRLLQVNGKPGEAIIKVVKTEGATILILGSRGIGKVQRAIMGSVSDYCVHHSPVPVLVCRNKDKK